MSYQEIIDTATRLGKKADNATRRMRELTDKTDDYTPLIEPIKNEKRIITGYRWIGIEKPKVEKKPEPLFEFTPTRKNHYDY